MNVESNMYGNPLVSVEAYNSYPIEAFIIVKSLVTYIGNRAIDNV